MTPEQILAAGKEDIVDRPLSDEEEIYKENILDHYKHPHNAGKLKRYTITCSDFNPLCGDRITIYLYTPKGKISQVSFEGHGCAISQAAASMLTDFIIDKKVKEIKELGPWDIFNLLGIRISHTRSKCALLCLKTIQEGIREAKL